MTATTEQIQLHVLGQLARTQYQVTRAEAARALSVKPAAVDAAMARCALVTRHTANGGAHIRYRLA
jgi:hypothetical protein